MKKVIDISTYNHVINWAAVKQSVDAVIARCGYGSEDIEQIDDEFYDNVKGCQSVELPMGAYHYGYAVSVAEARQEAYFALKICAGIDMDYPIFYDVEDNKTMGTLSPQELTDVINAFCEVIEAAGRKPGAYANTNWLENKMYTDQIPYDIWAAQYYKVCQFEGNHVMWQYASDGAIDGIEGNVDMNYCYKDYADVEPQREPQEAPQFVAVGKCKDGLVDVYAEDDPNSRVLFQLAQGNDVNIYGNTVNCNYNINCLHGNGYVNCRSIWVPGEDEEPAEPQQYVTYTVWPGDTLSAIGEQYGVSYLTIAQENGIANPNNIYPGQTLTIPQ